ncbi:hypothetical protein OTU49_009136 [Cherax quadricarinatus]|uniref:Sulfotransferase domain-containing protein n=2 Tax=Cherax quadricarinatus TaxID=27406 RepID=A0AAW0WAG8_CHEQU
MAALSFNLPFSASLQANISKEFLHLPPAGSGEVKDPSKITNKSNSKYYHFVDDARRKPKSAHISSNNTHNEKGTNKSNRSDKDKFVKTNKSYYKNKVIMRTPEQSNVKFTSRHHRSKMLDAYRRRLQVWGGEQGKCGQIQVLFTKRGSLPPTALASYPGSGNTWTRNLLQIASGIFTGSIYNDQQLYVNGFLGEKDPWNSGTTFTQKTHDCSPSHIKKFNSTGILLLRNPYRAILAYHNFLFGGHTGYAPMSNYRRKDWSAFVHLQIRSWLETAINWTTQAKRLQVLHYENLKEDPVPHLSSVLDFFGLPRDDLRFTCLQEHDDWRFKRKQVFIPDNLEIFHPRERDKIDRAVRYVNYLLRKHNHPQLPLHLYEFYNNTPSDQSMKVRCEAEETKAACDGRVDHMNLAQFASTKVGWFLTQMFNTVMRYTRTDPISRIVGDSHLQKALPLNLPPIPSFLSNGNEDNSNS